MYLCLFFFAGLLFSNCNGSKADEDVTEVSFIKTIDLLAASDVTIPDLFGETPIEGFAINPTLERDVLTTYTGIITRFTLREAGGEAIPCNDGDSHLFRLNDGDGTYFTAEIIGDTGGDDVSDDRKCGCDSQIKSLSIPSFAIYYQGVASPFGIQPLVVSGDILCPNILDGHLVRGDREFGGKVDVFGAVVLRVSPDNSTILADISLSMIESPADRT